MPKAAGRAEKRRGVRMIYYTHAKGLLKTDLSCARQLVTCESPSTYLIPLQSLHSAICTYLNIHLQVLFLGRNCSVLGFSKNYFSLVQGRM